MGRIREVCSSEWAEDSSAGFTWHNGFLYRRVCPHLKDEEEPSVEQLVLPRPCRGTVLKLAHDIPASGHLGRRQTLRIIQQRFLWPGMTRDVAKYCRCCEVCQKSGGKARGQQEAKWYPSLK